jgi:hypothetical protein
MLSPVLMDNGLRNYLRRVPNGCVAYYPGLSGGGTTLKDYSGNANNGTITGATWVRLSSGLWVLSFVGSDGVVDCGSGASLDNLGTVSPYKFAFGAWVNPTSLGENNNGFIIEKTYIKMAMTATARAYFQIIGSDGVKTALNLHNSVPFNRWTYLVGLYDGANVIIITNTTVNTGEAWSGTISNHLSNNLNIGDQAGSNRCFNGLLALPIIENETAYFWNSAAAMQSFFAQHYQQERRYFGV